MPSFRLVAYYAPIPSGWHLATVGEVESNKHVAKNVFSGRNTWTISALKSDYQFRGAGYGYDIGSPHPGFGFDTKVIQQNASSTGTRSKRQSTNTDWGSKFQTGCIQPYKRGIEYFDVFTSALTTYSENNDENQFRAAKVNLSRMNNNFKAAKTGSAKMRDELGNKMTSLLSEQKAKEKEQWNLDRKMNSLKIRISQANERLRSYSRDLDMANRRLADSRRKERDARRKLDAARSRQSRNNWIPIIGQILNLTVENNNVRSAQSQVNSWRSATRSRESNVRTQQSEVNMRRNEMQNHEREKRGAAEELAVIKRELTAIQNEKQRASEFQGKVNLTSTYFATVFTRSQNAQANRDKDVERLMMTLKDTAKTLSTGNRVDIDQNRIRKIANALNEIQFKQPDKMDDLLDDYDF